MSKTFRRHADYREGPIVQGDRFADDCCVAPKMFLPKSKTDHDDRIRAWPIIFGQEGAAHDWHHAHHLEVIGGYHTRTDTLRFSRSGQRHVPGAICRERLKDMVALAPIDKVRI